MVLPTHMKVEIAIPKQKMDQNCYYGLYSWATDGVNAKKSHRYKLFFGFFWFV